MKKSFGAIVIALVAAMSFAGVAVAEEVDEEAGSQILTPVIVVDEENGLITIAIPIDGELPEGCLPDESGSTEDPDGEAVDGEDDDAEVTDNEEAVSYGPGDCIEFVVDHPSGEIHHGAIVSTVAKNLHPSMLDGIKKGEIMRMVAKAGKVADDDGDDHDDGDDAEVKAKKEKKEKPDKERGNSENAGNKERGNSENARHKENPGRENSNGGKKNG